MMRHYDNLGVARALTNARVLVRSLPIALCTRTIVWNFAENRLHWDWNDGKIHQNNHSEASPKDNWSGRWEWLVILGSDTENSYDSVKKEPVSDAEHEFLFCLSLLLRGYGIKTPNGVYSWGHHDMILFLDGKAKYLTFGEFLKLTAAMYFQCATNMTQEQLDELGRLENAAQTDSI